MGDEGDGRGKLSIFPFSDGDVAEQTEFLFSRPVLSSACAIVVDLMGYLARVCGVDLCAISSRSFDGGGWGWCIVCIQTG